MPQDSLGNLGSYHELALNHLHENRWRSLWFDAPVFASYVAYSIAEKPGLVAGFVAESAIAKEGFAFGKSLMQQVVKHGCNPRAGVSSVSWVALVGGFITQVL